MRGNKRLGTAAGLDDNERFVIPNETDDAERFAELCFLPEDELAEIEAREQEEIAKENRIKELEEACLKGKDFDDILEFIETHIQALNDMECERQIAFLDRVYRCQEGWSEDTAEISKLLLDTDFMPKNKTMARLILMLAATWWTSGYYGIQESVVKEIYQKYKNVFDQFISEGFDMFSYMKTCLLNEESKFMNDWEAMFTISALLIKCDTRFLYITDIKFFNTTIVSLVDANESYLAACIVFSYKEIQYMALAIGCITPSIQNEVFWFGVDYSDQVAVNAGLTELVKLEKKLYEKAKMLFEMFADNPYANLMANACQYGPLRSEANARVNALLGDLPEHIAVPFSLNTNGCFNILMNRIAKEFYPNSKDWKEAAELHQKVRNQKYFEEVAAYVTNTVFNLSPDAPLWGALPPICNRDNVNIWISSTLLSNADRVPYVPSKFAFLIAKNVVGALQECAKTQNGREQLVIANSIYNAIDVCLNTGQRSSGF